MRFLLRRAQALNAQQKANGAAVAIALLTIVFLNLECQPRPAGADTIKLTVFKSNPLITRTAKAATSPADENLTPAQRSARNLAKKVSLLEKGIAFLKSTPDYSAQFTKRELVNGELLDEQTILMKLRHEPFSVYLKWMDYEEGREVMYIDGINEGKMLVHAGGWKSKLPALLMAPDSSLAMREARYPVTHAGLLSLAETILGYNRRDIEQQSFTHCHELEDQPVGERICHCFVLEYKDQVVSKDYRKSITMLDKEWGVPVCIKNFGWAADDLAANQDLDEATLIEHYTYTDLKFRNSLSSLDFDHTNEDYNFRRQ